MGRLRKPGWKRVSLYLDAGRASFLGASPAEAIRQLIDRAMGTPRGVTSQDGPRVSLSERLLAQEQAKAGELHRSFTGDRAVAIGFIIYCLSVAQDKAKAYEGMVVVARSMGIEAEFESAFREASMRLLE